MPSLFPSRICAYAQRVFQQLRRRSPGRHSRHRHTPSPSPPPFYHFDPSNPEDSLPSDPFATIYPTRAALVTPFVPTGPAADSIVGQLERELTIEEGELVEVNDEPLPTHPRHLAPPVNTLYSSQSPLSSTTTCHYIDIDDIPEEQHVVDYDFSVITNVYPTRIANALNTILITLYNQRGYEDYLRTLYPNGQYIPGTEHTVDDLIREARAQIPFLPTPPASPRLNQQTYDHLYASVSRPPTPIPSSSTGSYHEPEVIRNRFLPTTFRQDLARQEQQFQLRAEQTLRWAEDHEDYSDGDSNSPAPTVWLFSQLPLDSYHSEDDSARDTPPESPAPSNSSIASSISGASQEQEESL